MLLGTPVSFIYPHPLSCTLRRLGLLARKQQPILDYRNRKNKVFYEELSRWDEGLAQQCFKF